MSKDWKVYLLHIIKHAERIKYYIGGVTYEEFMRDLKLQDSVLRNLEIIGEAVGRIPPEVKDQYRHIPWRKIKAMRNFLIHEYDDVDLRIVWEVITKEIPTVKKEILRILKEYKKQKP